MQIHVAKNGQQTGPFDEAQVREKLAQGEFAPTDLAWHADLAGWQPLSTLFPGTDAAAPVSPVAAVPVFPPRPDPTPTPAAYTPSVYAPPVSNQPVLGAGGYTPLPVAGAPGQLPPPQFYNAGAVADPNLASLGARFIGALVDWVLVTICIAPGYALLIIGSTSRDAEGVPNGGGMAALGTAGYLLGGLIYLALQGFLLARSGQSVGKKVAKTRVVRLDGSPAGFVGAFLMRSVVAYLPGVLCFIYAFVDLGFVFRVDRRCIHDLIAGTKVVRA